MSEETVARLLGMACNPCPSPAQAALLERGVAAISDWSSLAEQLATHRLGPLLHWQIKEYGIAVPTPVRRLLTGLYLRQRGVANIQTDILCSVLERFDNAGISSVVLKGGALAHQHYPEPALRPMDDLDILVHASDLQQARDELIAIGLRAGKPRNRYERRLHHWPVAHAVRNGVRIQIEMHWRVLNTRLGGGALDLDALNQPLSTFSVVERTAMTLRLDQFIGTQIQRLRHLSDPIRAIALADLAGLAEAAGNDPDWPGPTCVPTATRNAYAIVQAMTPISAAGCAALGLDPEATPGQLSAEQVAYRGWPMPADGHSGNSGMGTRMRATLLPSPCWMQLAYGCRVGPASVPGWLLHHPANALLQAVRRWQMGHAGAAVRQPRSAVTARVASAANNTTSSTASKGRSPNRA